MNPKTTPNNLLDDFLARCGRSGEFFEAAFYDPAQRADCVAKASARKINPIVLSELKSLNAGKSPQLDNSLKKLEQGAAAVVSGQQLGMLGGPMFTIYKALGAISLAAKLEAETGRPMVPVFWLQAEDHDFEEIKRASAIGEGEELQTISCDDAQGTIGDSVGYLRFGANFAEQVRGFVSAWEGDDTVKSAIIDAYSAGATISEGFCNFLQRALGRHGLLVFQPLSKGIKTYAKDFIASSFLRSRGIESALRERLRWIEQNGYQVQVPLKENSPLFFVAQSGPRERLVESGEGEWRGANNSYTKELLYRLLDEAPEKFTSSALIRPLLQDFLLPTAAYVAGPNEFNYWVELKPLYPFFGIPQPMVVPRPRFTLLEEKYQRLAEKAGAGIDDLQLSSQDFVARRLAGTKFAPEKIFKDLKAIQAESLNSLIPLFDEVDSNLNRALEHTRQSNEGHIDRLKAKYERSLTQREEAVVKQFERVKRVLYPGGKNQEEVVAAAFFFARYGFELADRLLAKINLESFGRMKILLVSMTGELREI